MKKTLFESEIKTNKRTQMINISRFVEDCVRESGIIEGVCVVFVPHTTAGVTINENADPDVTTDMLSFTSRLIPNDPTFLHAEGNSDSHIKTTFFGPSQSLIIHQGRLLLGIWQGIYFSEFDGPRNRKVYVKCHEG